MTGAGQSCDQPIGLLGPAAAGAELIGLGAQFALGDRRALRGHLGQQLGTEVDRVAVGDRTRIEERLGALSAQPCSSPTARQAAFTSRRLAALFEPLVAIVSEPSSPARGSRP